MIYKIVHILYLEQNLHNFTLICRKNYKIINQDIKVKYYMLNMVNYNIQ